MNKEEVVAHLRAAKTAHVKWVQKAKLLINGMEIEKDAIPIDSTECKFGVWFYGHGQMLNALANNPQESMTTIERLHFELHDTYLNIFNVYFDKNKKSGFFANIFGLSKKTVNAAEYTLADSYYKEMERISHGLLEEINRLERRVIATSDDKIDNLV